MIHALIDADTTKNVVGFEVGTRAEFDARHGGDPLWIFMDYDVVKFRLVTSDFLQYPYTYYFDSLNSIQKKIVQSGTTGQVS